MASLHKGFGDARKFSGLTPQSGAHRGPYRLKFRAPHTTVAPAGEGLTGQQLRLAEGIKTQS